jgi:hypothetical protein
MRPEYRQGLCVVGVRPISRNIVSTYFSTAMGIDRNCDMLPLSLDDLLNYTTLMLKFCTNKPIWASLLRQVFFGGGKGGFCQKKRCNASSAGYGISRKKILCKLNTFVSFCKDYMYFNKYDMCSIIGIDKIMYGEGIGITVKYKIHTKKHTP